MIITKMRGGEAELCSLSVLLISSVLMLWYEQVTIALVYVSAWVKVFQSAFVIRLNSSSQFALCCIICLDVCASKWKTKLHVREGVRYFEKLWGLVEIKYMHIQHFVFEIIPTWMTSCLHPWVWSCNHCVFFFNRLLQPLFDWIKGSSYLFLEYSFLLLFSMFSSKSWKPSTFGFT